MAEWRLITYGRSPDGRVFTVERIMPDLLSERELQDRGVAISGILLKAWRIKLPPDVASEEDIRQKVLSPQSQPNRSIRPSNKGRHWIVYYSNVLEPTLAHPRDAIGMLRVEESKSLTKSPCCRPN